MNINKTTGAQTPCGCTHTHTHTGALKTNKGITLIALVVTVIVLLILAAITIPMLIGENSLIFRAKEAKKETKREVIIERIELSTLRSYEPDGTLKIDPLKENIHEDIPEAIIEGDEFPIKVKVDDVVVIIDGEGDVVLPKDFTVTLSQYSYIYDGIEKRPEVTVKEGEKILQEGIDYKVKYINNIEVGTATVIVTGQGDYEAIKKVNFVIQPVRMATVTKSNKTYNGKEQTGITGENINVTGTEKGIDAGKYTVTVKPITDYTWADGTTEAKIIEWEIVAKSINVEWEDKTVFLYNGKEQAPSASATSGVSGEVINIERTTAIEAGEHTSTASISSVTGGRAKKENYILIGNTKQYEINGYSYTIKYNGNGETQGVTEDSEHFYEEEKQLTPNGFTRSYVVTYNHNYNGSTDTTKTATYTFNGWATTAEGEKVYDNNQKVINLGTSNGEIVNLYANWSSSSVTYNPIREGYTFTGWYKEAECTNKVSEGEYIPTANITLYAKWTVNSYTATFNSNGGTTANPSTITKQYGAQLGTLPTTSRAGYTFTGWFTEVVGGTQVTEITQVTGHTTYYAHWTANNYTITYDQNYYGTNLWTGTTDVSKYTSWQVTPTSQTTIEDRNVMNGQIIKFVMPSGAGKTGGPYYRYGAITGKLTEGKQYTWSIYVKSNINKAVWIGSEQAGEPWVDVTTSWQKVTHTFIAQGESASFVFYSSEWNAGDELYIHSLEIMEGTPTHTTVTKAYGTNLETLPVPTRTGYSFEGWYTAPTGGTIVNSSTSVPIGNVTYYAHWRKTTANSYTATFNSNGGTTANPATITKQYGAQLGTLPTTSRVNYTFAGWFTAASGGTQILTTTTMGSANVTYYAHWVANPSATITANPVSTTVVAGNAFSFSVAATGNGTLSYQWYSATSSTAAGTAIAGATSATYTATSSSGLNGKYYYCVVTSKVDSSTKTATSGRALLTVQAANYSIVKSNVTTYYNTLATAIAGATSGGGDAGGGTITVLNNVTDTSGAAPNKTITINTNGKTLTRNSSIMPTAGTLTVSGSGTIDCIADNPTIYSMGGNIIVSSATIIGLNNAVGVGGGYAGTITITGATIYSTKRSAVFSDRNRKYYNN